MSTFLLCVPGENKPVAFAFVTVIVERENKRNTNTGGREEREERREGGWVVQEATSVRQKLFTFDRLFRPATLC